MTPEDTAVAAQRELTRGEAVDWLNLRLNSHKNSLKNLEMYGRHQPDKDLAKHHVSVLEFTIAALQRAAECEKISAELEHLKEEKCIQDAINQAWATDARGEYKALKDKAQGLLKALEFYTVENHWSDENSDFISDEFYKDSGKKAAEAIAAFKSDEIEGGGNAG